MGGATGSGGIAGGIAAASAAGLATATTCTDGFAGAFGFAGGFVLAGAWALAGAFAVASSFAGGGALAGAGAFAGVAAFLVGGFGASFIAPVWAAGFGAAGFPTEPDLTFFATEAAPDPVLPGPGALWWLRTGGACPAPEGRVVVSRSLVADAFIANLVAPETPNNQARPPNRTRNARSAEHPRPLP